MATLKISLSALLCLLLLFPGQGSAIADENKRPRIGLVLGGGGARGAAHIGVLRELERLRIPIDAIAGSSMGAIVGGLYASGMTAAELEEIVVSLDWAKAMSDTPQRSNLSFRRKQDDVQYPVDLELGVRDGGLVLPKGVYQGQNLLLLLRKHTADVTHVTDFDALPIPFRAVAANLENGEPHVISEGDLALSMRASMSVPGFIAPTVVDDKLLVDGGLVANLPVSVIRDMEVDVVIAVDVEFPLYPTDLLQSAPAITEQMLTILIRKETLRQKDNLRPRDILIEPELETFASSNFARAGEAIATGRAAVATVEARLSELALPEAAYRAHVAERDVPPREAGGLAFVRINHDGQLATELLAARLGVSVGDALDTDQLAKGASRLYGLKLYEQVGYRLVEEDGRIGVEYTAVAKSWGPDYVNVGVSLQDDYDGSTSFSLSARLTRTGLNRHGAEWRTEARVGTDLGLKSELYLPFGRGLAYFVAPRFEIGQRNQNAFSDGRSTAQLRVLEGEFGIDIGAELGTAGEFRFGAYSGGGEARVKIGDPALGDSDFETGGVRALLRFDTFDEPRFPGKGLRARLEWDMARTALSADDDFEILAADFSQAWSYGRSHLNLGLSYKTSFGLTDQVQEYFPLGGFLQLSGLEYGRVSGPHAALARLVYYRLWSDYTGGLFEIPVYLGASAEIGNVWQDRRDIDYGSAITSGSLFAAFDTYIGAVYLAAGFAEGGEHTFYLSIGTPPR